jgi:Phosphoenolpyruvate-protein kinase (PTS system EI component in bacteria)
MYPMISGLEELKQANALVEEYKAELRTKACRSTNNWKSAR